MARATARIDVAGIGEVRRLLRLFAQANEVIDDLQSKIDDLTDENNTLRAANKALSSRLVWISVDDCDSDCTGEHHAPMCPRWDGHAKANCGGES